MKSADMYTFYVGTVETPFSPLTFVNLNDVDKSEIASVKHILLQQQQGREVGLVWTNVARRSKLRKNLYLSE